MKFRDLEFTLTEGWGLLVVIVSVAGGVYGFFASKPWVKSELVLAVEPLKDAIEANTEAQQEENISNIMEQLIEVHVLRCNRQLDAEELGALNRLTGRFHEMRGYDFVPPRCDDR